MAKKVKNGKNGSISVAIDPTCDHCSHGSKFDTDGIPCTAYADPTRLVVNNNGRCPTFCNINISRPS